MPTRTRTLQAQAPSWLAALLTEHEKTWIGPVAMATYKASRRYVGGFLGTCEVKPQMSAATRRAATDHPAWSTVKTLRVHGGVSDSHALTFPLQACMRGLRRLEGAFPSDFIVLATRKPPLAIDHLVLDFQYTNELDLIAAEHAAVGTAPGLPCLVDLSIPRLCNPKLLPFLKGLAWASRIERLHRGAAGDVDVETWIWALRSLEIEVATVILGDEKTAVTLARDGAGRWSRQATARQT